MILAVQIRVTNGYKKWSLECSSPFSWRSLPPLPVKSVKSLQSVKPIKVGALACLRFQQKRAHLKMLKSSSVILLRTVLATSSMDSPYTKRTFLLKVVAATTRAWHCNRTPYLPRFSMSTRARTT